MKLRTESSVSSSVAALAIAAHEVGHAEQFAKGYWAARATRCLLVLLVLGGGVLFVYPFAAIIAGTGEVNLTRLVALLRFCPCCDCRSQSPWSAMRQGGPSGC